MSGSDGSTTWRYIDLGPVGPFEMMGQMPVLGGWVRANGQPVMTTSAWARTHLNVGWFDDVDATLDLARCDELAIDVVRRPMFGGGTAYYQAECSAMWAWLLPGDGGALDATLERFQPVVLDALARLGCGEVEFEGSSDLRWQGRKLGALTVQDVSTCISVGGFLNTRPPDLDAYLEVVRIPDDKFADKVVTDMRSYVCTLEEVAGEPVSYERFRDALVAAVTASGDQLDVKPLTDEETAGMAKIAGYIADPAFVRRVSSDRFRAEANPGAIVGFGNHKGHKLCRAGVAIDDQGVIASAMFAGDMHVGPPDVIDRVAAAVVGARVDDADDLRRRISSVFDQPEVHQAEAHLGVTTDDLLAALTKAIASASGPMAS